MGCNYKDPLDYGLPQHARLARLGRQSGSSQGYQWREKRDKKDWKYFIEVEKGNPETESIVAQHLGSNQNVFRNNNIL